MTKTKQTHTPGPWKSYGLKNTVIQSQVGCQKVIASIAKSVEFEEEDDANAHLIASAPELLEALKECLEILEMDRVSCWDGDKHPKGPTYLQVEKAIAKAEGK